MGDQPSRKGQLIMAVQRICRIYSAAAASQATEAIRYPKDKEKQETARVYVSMDDALSKAEMEIVDQIHAFWPPDAPTKSS